MNLPYIGGDALWAMLPFAVLAVGGTITTLLGAGRTKAGVWGALGTLIFAGIPVALRAAGGGFELAFWDGALVSDLFGAALTLMILVCGLFALLTSQPVLARENRVRAEYYGLLLFSLSGMALLVSTTNFLMLFLALELMSIPLYVLCGYRRGEDRSGEAALKYFVLGSFSSAIFLFGVALLFGATGSIDLAAMGEADPLLAISGTLLVLVGFFFKVGAVPFHMWAPDVYDGAPTPITSFMATAVKIASFGVLLRILTSAVSGDAHPIALFLGRATAPTILSWLAVLTMTVGNLCALTQTNVKRMLAYSSIAHAGYLLLGLIPGSGEADGAGMIYYLIAYLFMTSGAFAVVAALSAREKGREVVQLDRYSGVGYRRPFLGIAMTLFMISLAGIPPTAGFFGKYLLFRGAVERGLTTLVVIAVLNSAASLYYYLRVVVVFYMKETERPVAVDDSPLLRLAVLLGVFFVLWVGFVPDWGGLPGVPTLLEWVRSSAAALP
ncbi:MAG: NADH-quinone oxidoreductase subunit N [Candidatus Eisenbacteria bacterium]